MNEKMLFYYNPMSRGRIAHWMLEEVQADYEIKILSFEKGEHKSPDYLKINPMGKIPSLVHKGVTITETAAICAYLADVFPEAGLAPKLADPSRGSYYRWLFFSAACIEPAMLDKSYPRQNSPAPGHMGHGATQDVINTIEGGIKDGFLVGDKFSVADLYLCSILEWYIFTKVLEPKPIYTDYIKLCHDRPGHKRFLDAVGDFKS